MAWILLRDGQSRKRAIVSALAELLNQLLASCSLSFPGGNSVAIFSGRKYRPMPHTARKTPRKEQSTLTVVAFCNLEYLSKLGTERRVGQTYFSHCALKLDHGKKQMYQETVSLCQRYSGSSQSLPLTLLPEARNDSFGL